MYLVSVEVWAPAAGGPSPRNVLRALGGDDGVEHVTIVTADEAVGRGIVFVVAPDAAGAQARVHEGLTSACAGDASALARCRSRVIPPRLRS